MNLYLDTVLSLAVYVTLTDYGLYCDGTVFTLCIEYEGISARAGYIQEKQGRLLASVQS